MEKFADQHRRKGGQKNRNDYNKVGATPFKPRLSPRVVRGGRVQCLLCCRRLVYVAAARSREFQKSAWARRLSARARGISIEREREQRSGTKTRGDEDLQRVTQPDRVGEKGQQLFFWAILNVVDRGNGGEPKVKQFWVGRFRGLGAMCPLSAPPVGRRRLP